MAFGDAIFKLPLDLAQVLSTMWGCPIHPTATAKWATQRHMPPYLLLTPSVIHFSVQKGDKLVFASDGLQLSLRQQGVPDQDVLCLLLAWICSMMRFCYSMKRLLVIPLYLLNREDGQTGD